MSHKPLFFALGALALGVTLLVTQLTQRSGNRDVITPRARNAASTVVSAATSGGPEEPPAPVPEAETTETRAPAEWLAGETPPPGEAPAAHGFDPRGLYGSVVDVSLQAIPGAQLLLFPAKDAFFSQERARAATTSDEEGRYRFNELSVCEDYFLYAQAEGYLPVIRHLTTGRDTEISLRESSSIRGRVLQSETRAPLANATVYLELWHWEAREASLDPESPGSPGLPGLAGLPGLNGRFVEFVESISGEDGDYALTGARLDRFQKVFARRDASTAPQSSEFQVDPEQPDGYDILLGTTNTIELELYDMQSGKPLALEVEIRGTRFTSDAQGLIPYSYPSADHQGYLTLNSTGYCKTTIINPSPGSTKRLRVPLTRGATLQGRVVDGVGQAFEGARVYLKGPNKTGIPGMAGVSLRTENNRVTSASDGSFAITGITPSDKLLIVHADHKDEARSARTEIHLRDFGATATVELVLGESSLIRGILSIDGEPGAAEIRWSSENGSGRGRSNDHGTYQLRGVPPGEITLKVRLDGIRSRENEDPGEVVLVRSGQVLEHDIDFRTDRIPIAGIVVDERGLPLGGVNVYAAAELDDQRHSGRDTTDAEGSFRVLVTSGAGLFYRLSAHKEHRVARKENVSPGTEGLELVLPDVGLLRLKALDAFTRKPLGARLYYRRHPEEALTMLYQGGSSFQPGPDGSFLAKLPIGTFEVLVTAGEEGYAPARIERVRITRELVAEATVSLDPGVPTTLLFKGEPAEIERLQRDFKRNRILVCNAEQNAERKRGGPYYSREVRGYQRVRRGGERRGTLRGLAPGTYSFQGVPKGLRFQPATFEIEPRDRQEITIRVESRKKNGNKKGAQR